MLKTLYNMMDGMFHWVWLQVNAAFELEETERMEEASSSVESGPIASNSNKRNWREMVDRRYSGDFSSVYYH